MPKYQ